VGDPRDRTSAGQALPRAVAATLPIYYGWVVLACLCCAGFARQRNPEMIERDLPAPRTSAS